MGKGDTNFTDGGRGIAEVIVNSDVNVNGVRVGAAGSVLCGPVFDYPRDRCVHELFEEQVRHTPEAVAVEMEGSWVSYRELNARANLLAKHLRQMGVSPDTRVAIYVGRSLELVVGVLGILKAGGAYVPLDPRYPSERLAYMVEDAKASVLLTQTAAEGVPNFRREHTVFLDAFRWIVPEAAEDLEVGARKDPPAGESLAYVIYTSGSTGKPKGVAMGHRALVNLLTWQIRQSSDLPPGARTVQFTSLSFDVSFQEIFSTLCSGGTLVLMPEELRYDSVGLLRFLEKRRIHRLFLPFVALQQMAEASGETGGAPGELREVITAGEQLQITPGVRAFFRKLPGAMLHNHYGPSETHVATAHVLPRDVAAWGILPPIGQPIANVQIHLLDPTGTPVSAGEPGELFIGGDCLARGYLDRPEATAERFVTLLSGDGEGQRWYRTGDQARENADGNVEFLGRLDDQIKIRGYRIEPGEIEAALARHPAVRECAVAAHGEGGAKQLAAYVVAARDQQPTSDSLRRFLQETLAEYMVPVHYVVLEELPLTPSGKIDRRGLPVPTAMQDGAASTPLVDPGNAVEELLVGIWRDVLGRSRVGTRDNFFELGGTSLLVARVQHRLEAGLGRAVPITLLFQFPTIEQLAGNLNTNADGMGSIQRNAIAVRASRQREAMTRRRPATS